MSDQQVTQPPVPAPAPQVHSGQLTPAQETTPGVVTANCPTPDQVSVSYDPGVDRSDITDNAILILTQICSRACVSTVVVSSGVRSADSQARAMYQNAQTHGLERQRHLYGPEGNLVLDQYQQGVAQGLDAATIQSNMAQVIRQHPDAFHHVSRAANVSVFDVRPSSVAGGNTHAGQRLVNEARADARVVRFFQPPNDPGYHFEIQNP
jgi:hypothetical protein